MNVYEEVRYFYEEELAGETAIGREWVEGFLRQKAWQGTGDAELRDLWQNLRMFILYLCDTDAQYLEDISSQEYSQVIRWLSAHIKGFKATLKPVRRFFNVLIDFYRYLALKKVVTDTTDLESAAKEIAGGNKVKLEENAGVLLRKASDLVEELSGVLDEIIEGLMLKLGGFFQRQEFNDDFQRALFMFAGPLHNIPDPDPGEFNDFWQEFWDFFLFDYHLLANDQAPLMHFAERCREEFSSEERKILDELLLAKFTVFTVHRIISADWVECINLFTNEKFELPHPDFDYKTMRSMLFFGHVFAHNTIMVNYITSVEMSTNLRRRVKEEAERQKTLFDIQNPGATWTEFFARHSLAFRHTVDTLISLAKVNVTPFDQVSRKFPHIETNRQADPEVTRLFTTVMPEYGFSYHDRQLAMKLWQDFSQLAKVTIRKPQAWAAAVVYTYAQLNSPQGIGAEQLAVDFGVATSSLYANRNKLYEVLELAKYDPRYLSEEGLIYSLFTS